MCFHSKQSKEATEVENRFNAQFDNIAIFKPQENINGFEFPATPVSADLNSVPIPISIYNNQNQFPHSIYNTIKKDTYI